MAQVRDSCFRVMDINDIDIDLLDLHKEHPVTVEIEHERYSEELTDDIGELQRGNIVNAMVQSQDVLHIDGIWRFLEVEPLEATLLTGIDDCEIPEDDAQELGYQIMTKGGAYKQFSTANDVPVTMFANQADRDEWIRLNYFDPYKDISDLLPEPCEPPFEVVHQWDKDKDIIRSYYIGDSETEFAESAKSQSRTRT